MPSGRSAGPDAAEAAAPGHAESEPGADRSCGASRDGEDGSRTDAGTGADGTAGDAGAEADAAAGAETVVGPGAGAGALAAAGAAVAGAVAVSGHPGGKQGEARHGAGDEDRPEAGDEGPSGREPAEGGAASGPAPRQESDARDADAGDADGRDAEDTAEGDAHDDGLAPGASRRPPTVTEGTVRPEGGGRAAPGDAPAPARQWPLLTVLGLTALGLLIIGIDPFPHAPRIGALLIGAALLTGAGIRRVLPSVGMLAVRSRFTDMITYGVLGAAIVLFALMTQPNPWLEIPFLKDLVRFTVR
ncbi:hypothetical protein J116_009905 [Streptomyces thermolilacinus SPC6]|uniref:DUF3017 domain-containing protein n=1 Tax=Streptomyces thermolilacinus SPC6 TaxID=1306406 RepID=A0A1D3DR06_9ACTN|nr:hypothetical protein J116_009905 [Streptomyces thermolilacinus SPC6]